MNEEEMMVNSDGVEKATDTRLFRSNSRIISLEKERAKRKHKTDDLVSVMEEEFGYNTLLRGIIHHRKREALKKLYLKEINRMFDYRKLSDTCVNMQLRTSVKSPGICSRVQLKNGLTADEFLEDIDETLSPDHKMIAIDQDDIAWVLAEKDDVFYGRLYFGKTERYYCTLGDLSWLRRIKAGKICLFKEGAISVRDACDIVDLIQATLPKPAKLIFSYEERDLCIIKVDILAA